MKTLNIKDRLYGECLIDNPVLIEIINSQALNRLKKINQLGVPDKYYHKKGFPRYEHTVGVMLLLRLLGADEKNQLAGLLHDAPHMAFSHVYDFLDPNTIAKENYHDQHAIKILSQSDVPSILLKHGYDLEDVLNHDQFPLLKSENNNLSADRIDYSLREMASEKVPKFLEDLSIHDNQITFTDQKTARKFSEEVLNIQKTHWGASEGTNRYYYFAKALKIAIKLGYITNQDFLNDDNHVTKKLENINNSEIRSILRALTKLDFSNLPETDLILPKKFRHVDPHVLINNEIFKLSDIDHEFKEILDIAKHINSRGIKILKID
ncbi:HD domain-containing protein [Patescibacteria group bacterium]|nr:HD domain-containing protein [Patescibacteria group bacterium]